MKFCLVALLVLLAGCADPSFNEGCAYAVKSWKGSLEMCTSCAPECAPKVLPEISCNYKDDSSFWAAPNARSIINDVYRPILAECHACAGAKMEVCYPGGEE